MDEKPTTWECDKCSTRYHNATSADALTHRHFCDGTMHSVKTIHDDMRKLSTALSEVADAEKLRNAMLRAIMQQAASDLRCRSFDPLAIAKTLEDAAK